MDVKAFLVVAASLCALPACSGGGDDELARGCDEGASSGIARSGAASLEPVRLVKAFSGASSSAPDAVLVRSFLVRTDASLGKRKAVFIHHSTGPKLAWVDYPGELIRSKGSVDYWLVRVPADVASGLAGATDFVVKYVADERVWWDNNGRTNYSLGSSDGPFLASDVQVLLDTAAVTMSDKAYSIELTIDVRNLSYHKAVSVLYSTDGWASAKVAAATFGGGYRGATGAIVPAPNRFGVEPWSVTITEQGEPRTVEFAVKFATERESVWDNNDGLNYLIAFEDGQGRLVNPKWVL